MIAHPGRRGNRGCISAAAPLVPTLRVGTDVGTLCVPARPLHSPDATQSVADVRSPAERGNEGGSYGNAPGNRSAVG